MSGTPGRRLTPAFVEVQVQVACTIEARVRGRGAHGEVVVLVDDNDAARQAMQVVLESHGFTVLPAASGATALALCESLSEPPDLLIVDVGMRSVSGIDVVQELSRARILPRVLLVSGSGRGVHELRNCPRLTKPFTWQQLIESARQAIRAQSSPPSTMLEVL